MGWSNGATVVDGVVVTMVFEGTGPFGAWGKIPSTTRRAFFAGLVVIVAACGGSSSDADPPMAVANEAVVSDSDVDDLDVADSNVDNSYEDVAGDLRDDESSTSVAGNEVAESDSSADVNDQPSLVIGHPIGDLEAMWASQPYAVQDNEIGIQFHNGVDYFVIEPEVVVLSAVSGIFQDAQVMERQPDGAFQVNLMIIADGGEVVTYSLEPSAGPADSEKIAEQSILSQKMLEAISVQRGDRVELGQPIGVLLGQDEWAHVHMTVKQSNSQPEIWLCPMNFMTGEERDELLEPTQVWADRLYNGSKNPALCNN